MIVYRTDFIEPDSTHTDLIILRVYHCAQLRV